MGGQQGGLDVYEQQEGYSDTWDIGGSRWSLYSESAFNPYSSVGTTTAVPLALLSAPPTYATLDGASANYGPQGASSRAARTAPWSPKVSPLPWMIAGVVVAVYLFHYIYFKKDRGRR
jgi:hypothetical protein